MSDKQESGVERPESHQKGARHENEAVSILDRKYRAERVRALGNNDPFRLADVMGLQADLPFAIVQVKTNRFTADDRRRYRSWSGGKIDGEHTVMEVWVRVDRDGWRMHRYDPRVKEFDRYFSTTVCDPSDVRDEWAEAFESVTPSTEL